MPLNENEQRLAPEFDRAIRLRDEGEPDKAVAVLIELIARLGPDDKRLRAHSFMQLGHTTDGNVAIPSEKPRSVRPRTLLRVWSLHR